MSLAVKYRPATLEEVIGQDALIKVLLQQLKTGNISHSYIFCGPSGDGKTSAARAFAAALNNGKGSPIEMDAASHSGVDDMRELVASAKERAIDAEYKVFVIDECFVAGTQISTASGIKNIEAIKPGDKVMSLTGYNTVLDIHKSIASPNRLLNIYATDGTVTTVTCDHLFMTPKGLIAAKNLQKGDELINGQDLCNLWQGVRNREQRSEDMLWKLCEKVISQEPSQDWPEIIYKNLPNMLERISDSAPLSENLLTRMCQDIYLEQETSENVRKSETPVYTQLRDMWGYLGRQIPDSAKKDLFRYLLFTTSFAETEGVLCLRSWGNSKEIILRKITSDPGIWNSNSRTASTSLAKNEDKQSFLESGKCFEGQGDERIEWDFASMDGTSRGQWRIYSGTIELEKCFRRWMGIGVPSEDGSTQEQSTTLSSSVQVRPCLSFEKVGDRGGWEEPSTEKYYCSRYQKTDSIGRTWVDHIEIYESGNSGRLTSCADKNIEVYDLTVAGDPYYVANNHLVHNCHSLSSTAWQSLLKPIEEPSPYTIFIFCTTNPEKIPATIVNRCQKFNFSKIDTKLIRQRLEYISAQEGFTNYIEACDFIAKAANGGMRDAISMLEKCAAYDTNLDIKNVLECLGDFSFDSFFNLTCDLYNQDEAAVIQIVEEYFQSGKDLKIFIEKYLDFCLDLVKYCLFKSMDSVAIPLSLESRCQGYASIPEALDYSNKLVDRMLQIKNMIRYDTNNKTTVEAMLISFCRGM